MAQQRNTAGGRERPQRCWATRTTSVTDVSSPLKTSPREIYASGGGLHVASTNAPQLCLLIGERDVVLPALRGRLLFDIVVWIAF